MNQLNYPKHFKNGYRSVKTLITVIAAALFLSGCASSGTPSTSRAAISGSSRIAECKLNDTLIQNSSQCLQDDAACYQLSNGQWCTGERGTSCPAGSVAVPDGMECPTGQRCFRVGETLECTIS
jgi:hypothetical protein